MTAPPTLQTDASSVSDDTLRGPDRALAAPVSRRTEIAIVAAVLAVATLLRLACVLALPSPLESDYLGYWVMANNLAEGRGLSLEDGRPTAWLSVGYPILLGSAFWLFGSSIALAKALNLLLGVASVLLLYLAARALFRSVAAAALGALLLAVCLDVVIYTAYIAKENLMTFLLLAQLALAAHANGSAAWRAWGVILFGVATGGLALTGNAALGLMPAFALLILFRTGSLARTIGYLAVAGLAAALVVAPVVWRNHAAFGTFGVNNNSGFNLYIGNNPTATPYFEDIATTPLGPRWQALIAEHGEGGASRIAGNLARRHIADHPGDTLRLALRKAVAFWEPPTHSGEHQEGGTERLVRMLWLVQYVLFCALALLSLVEVRRHGRAILVLLLMAAAYTGVHMIFYVIYRYRVPIMPVVCILAGLGAQILLSRLGIRVLAGR